MNYENEDLGGFGDDNEISVSRFSLRNLNHTLLNRRLKFLIIHVTLLALKSLLYRHVFHCKFCRYFNFI